MIKTKVDFLEGWLLSSQSEQFKKCSKSYDVLKKADTPKNHFCFDHINRILLIWVRYSKNIYFLLYK